MNLGYVEQVSDTLLIKHGLKQLGWKFEFDNAARRFGRCSPRRKIISLSRKMTELNLEKNFSQIYDTLLHEVAHALTRERYGTKVKSHGYEWKQICREIGGSAERCYDSQKVNTVKGKYVYTCINCGHEHYYHRKLTCKHGCGICCSKFNHNKFDLKYVLVLKEPKE